MDSIIKQVVREELRRSNSSRAETASSTNQDDQRRPKTPGGVLPYKGLMGTCSQPGYVFRDFCHKQCIDFIIKK